MPDISKVVVAVALNVRVAMGALLIKEILGLSDRAVVDAVSENPYLRVCLVSPMVK